MAGQKKYLAICPECGQGDVVHDPAGQQYNWSYTHQCWISNGEGDDLVPADVGAVFCYKCDTYVASEYAEASFPPASEAEKNSLAPAAMAGKMEVQAKTATKEGGMVKMMLKDLDAMMAEIKAERPVCLQVANTDYWVAVYRKDAREFLKHMNGVVAVEKVDGLLYLSARDEVH